MKHTSVVFTIVFLGIFVFACGNIGGPRLDIISGSENETLEPIIEEFSRETGIDVHMHYKGSVDIMLELEDGDIPFDAVWPANSLWISLGDKDRKIKHSKSIMSSPVVFGIRQSIAEELGFVDSAVYVADILDAIQNEEFTFMMTSATQSNSGASAYMGFLSALSGSPEVLTQEHLASAELKESITNILAAVNRSSGSSGWLKELFLESNYDAMVNYEALIIETNQELMRRGDEPLYVVYPVDGIVIADSPLGYVNNGDSKQEEAFLELQEYLLSAEVQDQLSDTGRRTGLGAISNSLNPQVFQAAWGIDTDMILSPMRIPSGEVIDQALNLYQTEFRKPSMTVFALDYSGSMDGQGESEMKSAMRLLLNQEDAGEFLIQTGSEDITIILPFSSAVLSQWTVEGNDQNTLNDLYSRISRMDPQGGTDIYSPVIHGLEYLASIPNLNEFQPAIILLTDGESNQGKSFRDFRMVYDSLNLDIPVFSIAFGRAQEDQLEELASYTAARVFDGKRNLISTFRKARGYN
jgi:Ca-activated chloride channel family protein